MIEVVINYDKTKKEFKIYESSTETLMISANLTEGLVTLNEFLRNHYLIKEDILQEKNIIYHIDGTTMIEIVMSNIALLKQLKNMAPSSFQISTSKFGTTKSAPPVPGFGLGESKLASNTGKGFGKGSFSGKFSGDSELVQSFKKLGPPPDKKNGGYYGKPSWKK
jgi:hypothetical protein